MPIPELIVRASRRPEIRPRPPGTDIGRLAASPSVETFESPRDRQVVEPPAGAFVPPPVPPQLLPEIVVKAKPVARPSFGFGPAAKVNLATLFAVVGGTLVAKILEDRSQAKLDEAMRELMASGNRSRPDSPLYLQPQTIPEIIVTGKAPTFPQVLPFPSPLITPDFDPFIMVPIVPRQLPIRPAQPDIVVAPVEIPQPQRSPANVPKRRIDIRPSRRPTILPGTAPEVAPLATPLASPIPSTRPSVRPSIKPSVSPQVATNPLTGIRTSTLQSSVPATERRAELRPQVAAAQQQCPPPPQCKKDEELEKPRDRCYKQLVKQGLFPSMDRTYDWQEIDCVTGRAL